MRDESLDREYYAIFDIVNQYDKSLLTVKGWGVTLSLAALAWGFQFGHYGLFLVASLSGAGFWIVESVIKRHQMRHYVRMREIEVAAHARGAQQNPNDPTGPTIDWAWFQAPDVFAGRQAIPLPPPSSHVENRWFRMGWLLPHVFLPHAISLVAGVTLLLLGIFGHLGTMSW